MMEQKQFTIYVFHDFYLTLTRGIDMPMHQHPTLQCTISLGQPFVASIGDDVYTGHGVLIACDQPHFIAAGNDLTMSFLIEPYSMFSRQLKDSRLCGRPYISLDDDILQTVAQLLGQFSANEMLSKSLILSLFGQLIDALVFPQPQVSTLDSRISDVLYLMTDSPESRLSARTAASTIALSESRLIHLFKNQLDTTFRSFGSWTRLGRALKLIWSGTPFTEAAHEAGFSDAAHLSRTARKSFGSSLSSLFRDQQFQVYYYTTNGEGHNEKV